MYTLGFQKPLWAKVPFTCLHLTILVSFFFPPLPNSLTACLDLFGFFFFFKQLWDIKWTGLKYEELVSVRRSLQDRCHVDHRL